MRITQLAPAEEREVADYVLGHDAASLYHQPAWCDVIREAFGHQTHYLVARDGSGVCGTLPLVHLRSVLFGDFWVSLPYFNYGGAVGDSDQIERDLMDHAAALARERGSRHVELRDRRAREDLGWPARTDKVAMLLHLPESVDALSSALGSKIRSQIRRPVKEGAAVTRGGRELLDDFYVVFSENMRDLGTPVYSRRFFEVILDRFPENASIVVVSLDGDPAASGFVLRHGHCAEIPWASSLRRYNRLGVNMLLYWEVLSACIESGVSVFDFGRSTRDGGTYRFKRQWGAEPEQLHWHYWLASGSSPPMLNPSNPKYRLAISTWQRLPLPVANLLGPRLVKYLP